MLFNMNELLRKARGNKYAIGAFNVNSFVYADAFIKAAEERKSPVILQFSPGVLKTYQDSGLVDAVIHIASISSVPVVIHLDHGKNLVDMDLALDYDLFSSYMIDGSSLNLNRNVALVNSARKLLDDKYIRKLHESGLQEDEFDYPYSLEAEIGHVGDKDRQDGIESSLMAIELFLDGTDVDSLAISIGNVHGQNERKTELNIDLLKKFNKQFFDIPFVLHGSSGVKDEDIKKAIKYGISKINVNTHFKSTLDNVMEESYKKYGKSFFSNYKLAQPLIFNAIKNEAIKKINLFGSYNTIVPRESSDNISADPYYEENKFAENKFEEHPSYKHTDENY